MLESLWLSLHISRRNWIVYKKDFIANVSPTVADPALIMVSLGLGLGGYVKDVEGMTYMQYLAPGLAVATALFTSFFESSYGFFVRMSYENIYKAMLTTPIGVREVVLGEFIWVALKGALLAIGVTLVLALCGLVPHWWVVPGVAWVGFFVALPCGAIGLLASAWVRNINQFQSVYSFLIAPLFYMSGIFFPSQEMHGIVRAVASFFPLLHGVQVSQALFWNKNLGETLLSSGLILVAQSIIFCALAYTQIKKKLVN